MFLRFSPAKRNVCTSSINHGVVLQADIFKNLGQLNSTIVVAVCSMVQRVLVVLQFDGLPCFFTPPFIFGPVGLEPQPR